MDKEELRKRDISFRNGYAFALGVAYARVTEDNRKVIAELVDEAGILDDRKVVTNGENN